MVSLRITMPVIPVTIYRYGSLCNTGLLFFIITNIRDVDKQGQRNDMDYHLHQNM